MANSTGVDEVLKFLESRGVERNVIQNFKNEKMDCEAIAFASDTMLKDMGLSAKGDVLALRAFTQRRDKDLSGEQSSLYDEKKRKLIEILKSGNNKKQLANKKVKEEIKTTALNKVKTRKITLGWMHYDSDSQKFSTVRVTNGGGTRRVDLPLRSTKEDIIEVAKKLFFPEGLSSRGNSRDMVFDLSNFQGIPIPEFLQDVSKSNQFSLQQYIEQYKLTQIRIYLTSKRLNANQDDDIHDSDDDLMQHSFKPNPKDRRQKWLEYLEAQDNSNTIESSDSESESLDHSLPLKASEERQNLIQRQDEEYQCSLEEDRLKQKKKEEREQEELELLKERDRLESLRLTRSMRVPPEPEQGMPRARVAVHHPTNGKLVRFFKPHEMMVVVYDWAGSQAMHPENLHLCISPEQKIRPSDKVSDCTLYMEAAEEPIEMSDDEISFKGFDFAKHLCDLDDITLTDIDPLFQNVVRSEIGDDLPLEHKAGSSSEGINEDFITLNRKRQEAYDKMTDTVMLQVKKESIVGDVLKFYKDSSRVSKTIIADIDGEDASGDGVLREVYSLFWDEFLTTQSNGDSEFTIPIGPNISEEEYIILGRIITHQFIQCGTFPVRIAQASMQSLLTGDVSDWCKIDSLLRLLPHNERECLSQALSGKGPFLKDEIMDVLEDFNIRQIPTPENIRTLVLQAAVAEFITKPFLGLMKIRSGMGTFWDGITASEIALLYELCVPTVTRVIKSLMMESSDPRESQIFRWLERYIRGASDDMLIKFLRFCTASDVLLPTDSISVTLESMSQAALRPKSFTCFRKLILPKNYCSYTQLRSNMDFYLRNSQHWDLHD